MKKIVLESTLTDIEKEELNSLFSYTSDEQVAEIVKKFNERIFNFQNEYNNNLADKKGLSRAEVVYIENYSARVIEATRDGRLKPYNHNGELYFIPVLCKNDELSAKELYTVPEKAEFGFGLKLIDYLYYQNEEHLDDVWAIFGNREITYRELFAKVDSYAKALKARGIKENDMVTSCMINSFEHVALIFAANKVGATFSPFPDKSGPNPEVKLNGLIDHLNKYNCEVLFISDQIIKEIDSIRNMIPTVKDVIVSDLSESLEEGKTYKEEFPFLPELEFVDLNDYPDYIPMKKFENEGETYIGNINADYDKNRVASLGRTSGTSEGKQKGVKLTDDSFVFMIYQYLMRGTGIKKGKLFHGSLPYGITSGIGFCLSMPTAAGMTVDIVPNWNLEYFVPAAKRRPCSFHLVTADMVEKMIIADMDFSQFDTLLFVAQPLKPEKELELLTEARKRGFKGVFGQASGMTEFAAPTHVHKPEFNEFGSSGPNLFLTETQIRHPETGALLTDGQFGDIYISSPSMAQGYDVEELNGVFIVDENGKRWLKTGDSGFMLNGLLFNLGKEYVIMLMPGAKVYSKELSQFVLKKTKGMVEDILFAAVDPIEPYPHPILVAHIQLNKKFTGSVEEVMGTIHQVISNSLMENFNIPFNYMFWPDFGTKKGDTGFSKVLEREIRETTEGFYLPWNIVLNQIIEQQMKLAKTPIN